MDIKVPKLSLVVLIGVSGSGKSTFAARHFRPTEVISSDYCRGLVSDDVNNQAASKAAFEVLHFIAAKRLERGLLTVIDATSVQPEAREPLLQLARRYHCLPTAIVFNLPEDVCRERNRVRTDREIGPHVLRNQRASLRKSIKGLYREGFRFISILETEADVNNAVIQRVPLWTDKQEETGPFDIIGDLHGCAEELEELLDLLGYQPTMLETPERVWGSQVYRHPQGRKAVFVGDLVDRGPRVLDCVRIVRNMVHTGSGLCVPGNHDIKLLKKLLGRKVQVRHGLQQSLDEIAAVPEPEREELSRELIQFLDGLVSHYMLDGGRLVVAHAGMKEAFQGRASARVRDFGLYGETTGETDEFGLPVRHNWAADYRGEAMVVYGHTPVPQPEWLNRTVCIDTGCVFGGRLTALQYPERTFVSVPARQVWCEPVRPFLPAHSPGLLSMQQAQDDMLDLADVFGKRVIDTRLSRTVTIREENSAAALEVMSRFAANPKWLIYLPPTMSPSETSQEPGYLEHPAEAFAWYRSQGVSQVVCEEKHMGSRAVVIVCRDEAAARKRFGVIESETGCITTRTGRRFFNEPELERACLERVSRALTASGFWETFQTDWACLDCELMPWSAKAQQLLQSQYAAVGAAGSATLSRVESVLNQAAGRLTGEAAEKLVILQAQISRQAGAIQRFISAYRHYCWPTLSLADYRLAPFHLLATEGTVHTGQNHVWHMDQLAQVCQQDAGFLLATDHRLVDLNDPASEQAALDWWLSLTGVGGEGMVVKPLDFIAQGPKGLLQPAVKCRGPEYLRIIYGPDYLAEKNLNRLRRRGLGRKRSLALREFALGVEALERFVRGEPLRRIHECVFGILALESEPVDTRL